MKTDAAPRFVYLTETPRIDQMEKMADSVADFAEMARPLEIRFHELNGEFQRYSADVVERVVALKAEVNHWRMAIATAVGAPDMVSDDDLEARLFQLRKLCHGSVDGHAACAGGRECTQPAQSVSSPTRGATL
jgi:hypothetical protein